MKKKCSKQKSETQKGNYYQINTGHGNVNIVMKTVAARTSAEASFPLNDNETVTIRPTSSSYRFEPESVTVSNQNNTDYKQIFTAIPL